MGIDIEKKVVSFFVLAVLGIIFAAFIPTILHEISMSISSAYFYGFELTVPIIILIPVIYVTRLIVLALKK